MTAVRKMVFVCNGHNPATLRWALVYLRDALVAGGMDASIVDLGRGGTEKDCEGADVVMVYRCVDGGTLELMKAWRRKGIFVLYFLDDYIFQVPCKYGGTIENWMAPVPFMEEADCLVSSSEHLLSKMPNKPKILRRTILGPEGMAVAKQDYRRGKIFSVGLTAAKGRKNWMDGLVADFLQEADKMMRSEERFVFHYFGEQRFPSIGKVTSLAHEYVSSDNWMDWFSKLKELDLGVIVNPLEESDEWCRCKSELKFVEAGAMGVPLVTSRVQPYTGFMKEGETGFFASTPKEFAEKVLLVMRDEALSRRLSDNVLKCVRGDYDARRNADRFLDDVAVAIRKERGGR